MTIQRFYIGSMGPFEYDDAELIDDPDGNFAGEYQKVLTADVGVLPTAMAATATDGAHAAGDPPTKAEFDALVDAYNGLIDKLQAAGIMV